MDADYVNKKRERSLFIRQAIRVGYAVGRSTRAIADDLRTTSNSVKVVANRLSDLPEHPQRGRYRQEGPSQGASRYAQYQRDYMRRRRAKS